MQLLVKHGNWNAMPDGELADLIFPQLTIPERIERFGGVYPVELEHLRRIHRIGLGVVIEDRIAHQQLSILFVQITDPGLDRFGGVRVRHHANRLRLEEEVRNRHLRRLPCAARDVSLRFGVKRQVVDGEVHLGHRAGWLKLITESLG